MKRAIVVLIFFFITIYANVENNDSNRSIDANRSEVNSSLDKKKQQKLNKLLKQLKELKDDESLNNEWIKTYSAYISHKNLIDRRDVINKKIKMYKSFKSLTFKQKENLKALQKELKVLEDKINLVKDFEKDPFRKIISPPEITNVPKITNPFGIISGFSYIKELKNSKNKYLEKYKTLETTINKLQEQKKILEEIVKLTNNSIDKQHLDAINKEIKELYTIKDIFKSTKDIYLKRADEVEIAISKDIKREFQKALYIVIVALFFLSIFIGLKYLTRKYFSDKDSYYTINKAINIVFITIIILILLFAYLENVSYLITILGFASAGIAIAMKDWFMSLLGWFVIVIGGAVHVGDRIKVVRGNVEYVGDIVDISLLRMTIQEDVTLTTYMHNRRAGRIIFVPNNYIFTDMIANYSHSGLKTVWDGIDFYITFDSNSQKAMNIAKNIAKQYSKGYTDITRKQLNKLRSKYQLKNTNVEPRVFSL